MHRFPGSLLVLGLAAALVGGTVAVTSAAGPWSDPSRVTFSSGDSELPHAIVVGDRLHVVWHDSTTPEADVFHRYSDDDGASWSPPHRISSTPELSAKPRIVATDQALVVAWEEGAPAEIHVARSLNGGDTWTDAQRVTWSPADSWRPRLAVTGSTVHLIWRDESPGNWEVYYKSSPDHGATWSPGERVTVSPGESFLGSLIAVGGTLHLVWQDATPGPVGNWEVFHKSRPQGGGWSEAHRVTWSDEDSRRPRITEADGTLIVLWRDLAPGNYEIFTRRSTDGGVTWTDVRRLTWSPGQSHPGEVHAAAGAVYAAWYDISPGNWEIYTKTSNDGGLTWGPGERVTNTPLASQFPQLTSGGGVVHLVYQDRIGAPANFEVYHATRAVP